MTYAREEIYCREKALLGDEGVERLRRSAVAVCGLGGVGSYTAEALARCGVGSLLLIDFDQVAVSNLNRQLCALHSTVGMDKADVIAQRIQDIDPACQVRIRKEFLFEGSDWSSIFADVDYVADAIDHLPAKAAMLCYCHEQGLPVISAMGAGRRLDPQQLCIDDISRSQGCPLARNLRRMLRQKGIEKGIPVVFSKEQAMPVKPGELGSIVFVPAVAGMLMASRIVRDLCGK